MKHHIIAAAVMAVLGASAGHAAFAQDEGMDARPGVEQAVMDETRPAEDRELDASRHPAEVLTFAGLEPGWAVADLTAGTGYYSRLLSAAVGPTGHVYAHNPDWVAERFPEADAALATLADGRENVTHVVSPIAGFADGIEAPLDAVFMVLFYHDTVWDGTDRSAMNSAIYDALAPGGVYVVIDHHAAEGTGVDHVEDLHRIEQASVVEEVMAAGFELDGESDMLASAADDHTLNVFDPAIRRQTDRFVLRFRKPE